jgi:hypothetical protein
MGSVATSNQFTAKCFSSLRGCLYSEAHEFQKKLVGIFGYGRFLDGGRGQRALRSEQFR